MTAGLTSVVLPVYNEAENIATCLRRLDAALAGTSHEILVCYDFDADTTLPAIAAMPDKPRSVRLVKNTLGKGAANALRAGFAAAQGDVVVTTMADLSDPPEKIPQLAAEMRSTGAAVIAGSRYMPGGSQSGGPLLKRTFSRWAGTSLRLVTGIGTHDATNNFRAYSKSFLERVEVESAAGFEIALELTAKAYVLGLPVGEVPSSWTDRSAGTSRFRMWKWMPSYLRWWFLAARTSLVVWGAFLAAVIAAWVMAGLRDGGPHPADWVGPRAGLERAIVALFAAGGALALVAARRARRRTSYADLVFVALWAHPFHPALSRGWSILLDVAGTALTSAGYALLVIDRERVRAVASAAWSRLRPRANQRTFGLFVLVVCFWLTRYEPPSAMAGVNLDDGWQQVMGHGLLHHLQWGRDLIFTFGPLGYFARGTYDPELWWAKVLWWDGIFKFAVAVGFVLVARRTSGTFERALYFFALLLANGGFDSFFFLALLGGAAFLLATPSASTLVTVLVLAGSTLIGLNKFTSLVLMGVGVATVGFHRWITVSREAALRFVALALLVFVAIWCAIGQKPWNLPAYVRSALWIADGHNRAMSWDGDGLEVVDAVRVIWVLGAVAFFFVLETPRALRAWLGAALFLFGSFVAFKAGFTRHGSNSITFFTFAAVAPFFLFPVAASTLRFPWLRAATIGARVVAVWLALLGMGRVWGNVQLVPSQPTVAFIGRVEQGIESITNLDRLHRRREREARELRREFDLPRIREIVRDEPIDMFMTEQGVLLANGFHYAPRPVFQSYVVYTPELCRTNADFMRSDRAPKYVLFHSTAVDQRLPNSEDGEALLVLSRDYRPVAAEKGYLLLERRAQPTPPPEPAVLWEGDVRFDEWIEVEALGHQPKLLAFDAPLSFSGKLRTFVYHAPHVYMDQELTDDSHRRARIEPGMTQRGVLLDPLLESRDDWTKWFTGADCQGVRRFRLRTDPGSRPRFAPTMHVRLLDGSAYRPSRDSELARELSYPMFVTKPDMVRTAFPSYTTEVGDASVLVVHAPSDMRFVLPPGKLHLVARFGLIEDAWKSGCSDGVDFAVIAHAGPRKDDVVWMRSVRPREAEKDRGLLSLDLAIPAEMPRELRLRTRVGPNGDGSCDWAFWTGIAITPEP